MAQWWEERELRILVLASLSAQYLLVLLAGVRKFHIPPWLRVSFRLAHIGSDALAIFGLATLFNRQKKGPGCHYARGSNNLELLWAPILVMHLGGQVVITSYKIEDNEQWSRHILTSLSKVTVALYVFYKSWSSDEKRLLAATILLFILVVIRGLQKALDLKSSSFNALRKGSSEVSVVRDINDRDERWLDKFIRWPREILEIQLRLRMFTSEDEYDPHPCLPYQLLLDFPCSYSDRVDNLYKFWPRDPESAYDAIEGALCDMTNFLYTKDDSTRYLAFKNAPAAPIFRRCTKVLAYATLITAICLVHTSSHKEAYSGEDTWVTLVLLYGTLLLELVYLRVQLAFRDKFCGRIFQHSLIGLAHNKWHSKLRRIAGWFQCKDLADEYFWHVEPSYSCKEITELVRLHVETGWKDYIRDNETYRRFNDTRGELTLANIGCFQELGWSIHRPFDESIILWHLATDLCFHYPAVALSPSDSRALRCKEMSNYMMHLLYENPEMLMPGSIKSLFARAYNELEDILMSEQTPRDEREFARKVFEKCNGDISRQSFICDAWSLAKSLLDKYHGDPNTMWKIIQGVWVEMLCFSAGRSRGYLHAETLGTGVEYLSYVWVLLAYAGMETFAEKLRRRESQSRDPATWRPLSFGSDDYSV